VHARKRGPAQVEYEGQNGKKETAGQAADTGLPRTHAYVHTWHSTYMYVYGLVQVHRAVACKYLSTKHVHTLYCACAYNASIRS
jgi:hypothetical protein